MPFPSPEQQRVIDHRGPPLVVVAGPGTGKTKTIVARMISLLQENPSRNITFVTFTRTSRTDTLTKLAGALPQDVLDQPDVITPRVGTLHGSARALVHRFARMIGLDPDFSIIISDMGERDLLVEDTLSDLGVNVDHEELLAAIFSFLCNLRPPSPLGMPLPDFQKALDHFSTLLAFYNALGMEEIVFSAVQILEGAAASIPPIFLQVDEYQDLNSADQRFVALVASNPESQVVVVGDDAQSIYRFRHAHYRGLRELSSSDAWETITFPDCHRLPPHVQRAAVALIADEDYLGSQMSPKPDNGLRVPTYQCTKPEYQAVVVAKSILDQRASLTRSDGTRISLSDILVLCPSGTLVPALVRTLDEFGISSRLIAKAQIPSHVWRLILVIRLTFHHDNIAFRQWLATAGISLDRISEIRRAAIASDVRLIKHCEAAEYQETLPITRASSNLREASATSDGLMRALLAFPNLHIGEDGLRELVGYLLLEDQSLSPPSKWLGLLYRRFGVLEDQSEGPAEEAVTISSFHSAKGLEAEVVYLTWMNERYMPLADRDIDEQRRLLYVGMTRAKQQLFITFHEAYEAGRGYLRSQALSPFLREIVNHLAISRIAVSDLR